MDRAECNANAKRGRFRFGIRSLLLLTMVCATFIAWFSTRIQEVNQEIKIRESLSSQGLHIEMIPRDLRLTEKVFNRKLYPDHYLIRCQKEKLDLLSGAGKLKHVEAFSISSSPAQFKTCSLDPISTLTHLKTLWVHVDESNDFEFLRKLSRLEKVILQGTNLKSLDVFENCRELKFLNIWNCDQLRDVSQLSNFESLETLWIDGPTIERYYENGGTCDGLHELRIGNTSSKTLEKINISATKKIVFVIDYLENLEGIEKFSNCEQIEFSGFVKDISALRNLANSKVKLVKFSKTMWGAEDVSKMDRLLNGISVIIYDE